MLFPPHMAISPELSFVTAQSLISFPQYSWHDWCVTRSVVYSRVERVRKRTFFKEEAAYQADTRL